MCGRYWVNRMKKVIVNEFNVYEVATDVKPDYNITPGRLVLCVMKNGHNKLVSFRWGLIPSWAKDPQIGYKMVNARAETLIEKPSFFKPFQTQRCLVVADGFYEWRKEGREKIPLAIRLRNDKPFAFAGLYDRWQSPENELITSCTIITTTPNELLAPIHNPIPAILTPEARESWLDNTITNPLKLIPLLKPYNAQEMEAYEVSSQVNSVKNNNPDLIKPVSNKINKL